MFLLNLIVFCVIDLLPYRPYLIATVLGSLLAFCEVSFVSIQSDRTAFYL